MISLGLEADGFAFRDDRTLCELLATFGPDGAAEFVASGYRTINTMEH
jgi:hypothetical protein